MIGYFDTSSLVPMLIDEPNADRCSALWGDVTEAATSRVTFVEAHAAVATAERARRIDAAQAEGARKLLREMWREMLVVELGDQLMYEAAACARGFGLRGFDAIHCASAMKLKGVDLLAVTGDSRLVDAWLRSGLTVANTSVS